MSTDSNRKKYRLLWLPGVGLPVILLLGLWFSGELDSWIPGAAKLEEAAEGVARAERSYRALKTQLDQGSALEKRWEGRREICFLPSRDGDPELELRRKIEPAATKVELSLNTIGAVRQSTVNPNLSFAEIDLSGAGTMEQVAGFLRELQGVKPLLFWKRLELRPEFRRGPGAENTTEERLQLNGTIRVLVIHESEEKK